MRRKNVSANLMNSTTHTTSHAMNHNAQSKYLAALQRRVYVYTVYTTLVYYVYMYHGIVGMKYRPINFCGNHLRANAIHSIIVHFQRGNFYLLLCWMNGISASFHHQFIARNGILKPLIIFYTSHPDRFIRPLTPLQRFDSFILHTHHT